MRSWHDRSPPPHPDDLQHGMGGTADVEWAKSLGRRPSMGTNVHTGRDEPGSQTPCREARSYRRLSDGIHHGLSGRGISVKNVARAIATFERMVISSTARLHRRTPLPFSRQSGRRCRVLWVSFRCRPRSGHWLRSIAMPAHARQAAVNFRDENRFSPRRLPDGINLPFSNPR